MAMDKRNTRGWQKIYKGMTKEVQGDGKRNTRGWTKEIKGDGHKSGWGWTREIQGA